MIQKATALGNWWLAASSPQHSRSYITSHVEFFGKTASYSDDSVPLQPRFSALWLLAFPKTKITFEKGRDFRPSMWFRETRRGSWWRLGELCEVPRSLLLRGPRHHCPMYNVSCILYLLQRMSLFFYITQLDNFWTGKIKRKYNSSIFLLGKIL